MSCGNHLKQIGIALQNYHDDYGEFPPAYIADSNGLPMHSWRVLILPYMENKNLYDAYRFDEPWDGPNNRKLHSKVIPPYCCPACTGKQPQTETCFLAIVGPRTMWPGDKSTKLADVVDGTSNTIIVVEVHNSGVHWMDPRDLHVGQMPLAINVPHGTGISSPHRNGANALFVDGHTQFLRDDLPPETLRRLLTISGGEKMGEF